MNVTRSFEFSSVL